MRWCSRHGVWVVATLDGRADEVSLGHGQRERFVRACGAWRLSSCRGWEDIPKHCMHLQLLC